MIRSDDIAEARRIVHAFEDPPDVPGATERSPLSWTDYHRALELLGAAGLLRDRREKTRS